MMVYVICAIPLSDLLFTELENPNRNPTWYGIRLEHGKIQSPSSQKKGGSPSFSNPSFLKAHLGQKHLSGFPSKDVVIAQH